MQTCYGIERTEIYIQYHHKFDIILKNKYYRHWSDLLYMYTIYVDLKTTSATIDNYHFEHLY